MVFVTTQVKSLVETVHETLDDINKRADASKEKLLSTSREMNQHLDVIDKVTGDLDLANLKLRELLGSMSNFPPEDTDNA